MPDMDRDQLEALRHRVEDEYRRVEEDYRRAEENYRLDIAAIEHLQRRFCGALTSIPTGEFSAANGLNGMPPATMQTPQPALAGKAKEEWEIFKAIHR
jgi:hypothetical protein